MSGRPAPQPRPPGRPLQLQSWRDLLFLHWPVPEAALRALIPAGLSLDLHQGTAYVGLVAFAIQGARFAWMPARWGLDFLETNVRTYVRRGGVDPGVYFFSLDAASPVAVAAARIDFGLPYYPAHIRVEKRGEEFDYRLRRLWRGRPHLRVHYRAEERVGPAPEGTLDHFLIERYLLHVERRGKIWTGQVHHEPYPLRRVSGLSVEEELVAACGLERPRGLPLLSHFSSGVDVEVFRPEVREG